jgi:hypothetical protein
MSIYGVLKTREPSGQRCPIREVQLNTLNYGIQYLVAVGLLTSFNSLEEFFKNISAGKNIRQRWNENFQNIHPSF